MYARVRSQCVCSCSFTMRVLCTFVLRWVCICTRLPKLLEVGLPLLSLVLALGSCNVHPPTRLHPEERALHIPVFGAIKQQTARIVHATNRRSGRRTGNWRRRALRSPCGVWEARCADIRQRTIDAVHTHQVARCATIRRTSNSSLSACGREVRGAGRRRQTSDVLGRSLRSRDRLTQRFAAVSSQSALGAKPKGQQVHAAEPKMTRRPTNTLCNENVCMSFSACCWLGHFSSCTPRHKAFIQKRGGHAAQSRADGVAGASI